MIGVLQWMATNSSGRIGKEGGEVAWLSMFKECFEVTELMTGDNKVESLWVKIRGRADKADILVASVIDRQTRMKRQMSFL